MTAESVLIFLFAFSFMLAIVFMEKSLSLKNKVALAKEQRDQYEKKWLELQSIFDSNERYCSTCHSKTCCPYSLGDSYRHWIVCPMWERQNDTPNEAHTTLADDTKTE